VKKRPPFNQNAAIRGAIRRTFSRSPVVREVLQKVRREVPKYNKDGSRAKKDSVQYQCNMCKEYVGSTKIAVDHIEPVIHPVHGFKDWNQFVDRLFCDASNLQPICQHCHQAKTNSERQARQLIKDSELLEQIQNSDDENFIREGLKKFTKKKLQVYPQEIVEKVLELRAQYKKAKKNG
jgi:5-methylcytosine-specific restriction endonuclease McrA